MLGGVVCMTHLYTCWFIFLHISLLFPDTTCAFIVHWVCLPRLTLAAKTLHLHPHSFYLFVLQTVSGIMPPSEWSSLRSNRIFEFRVISLLFASLPLLHLNLIVSWLLTAAVKSCFSLRALELRLQDISRWRKRLRIWKPQSSMIHSQTAVWESKTLSVILNPHMMIFVLIYSLLKLFMLSISLLRPRS